MSLHSFGCVCTERSQLVASHIVAITSPPDGRYAPLPLPLKTPPRTYQGVRALVLPLAGAQAVEQVTHVNAKLVLSSDLVPVLALHHHLRQWCIQIFQMLLVIAARA